MLRRLFFLFPDESQAQRVVDQLIKMDISIRHIHAISHNKELKTLPEATVLQKKDIAYRAQSIIWNLNLVIFAFAMITFFITLAIGDLSWIIAAFVVMAASFFAGKQFLVHVPDVHITEFTDALSHGDILLMIDVPNKRVREIEDYIHNRFPDAVVGGVGWSIGALGT